MNGGNVGTAMWLYSMPQIGHLKTVKMVHFMVCKFYYNLKSNETRSLADSRLC